MATKQRRAYLLEGVQRIGNKLYPRVYVYLTRKEAEGYAKTLLDDPTFQCVELYESSMTWPKRFRNQTQRESDAVVQRNLERRRETIRRQHARVDSEYTLNNAFRRLFKRD